MDIKELFEQRDAAATAFREFAAPIIAEKRDMTDEETAKSVELRGAVDELDARIKELAAEKARDDELAAARKTLLGDETRVGDGVRVKSEPRTYGEGSPNSYFADFVRASSFAWKGHEEAKERLARHSREVAEEVRSDSAEGKRARTMLQESHRSENGVEAREALREVEARAGMDTTSGSGGSFVTPQYFESEYAAWRHFGRPFADAAHSQDLPDYGMTVFIPAVQGPAGVAAQVGQNQGVAETDPVAGYLSNSLVTNAGEVLVSQQLLDRAGPNFRFDQMIFDQLRRAYDVTFDQYVLTQALASAGSVTLTSTTLVGTGSFYSKVGQAKANMQTQAGTIMPATHIFAQPVNWEWYAAQVDSQNRPLIVPSPQGQAFNAVANGDGTLVVDGYTGYRVSGLPVFEDGNIPATGGNNQVVVAHMPEVWVWEGALVPRTIPQTYAQNLSVLLQLYAYGTVIVRYPKAVQAVTGAGVPLNPTF